jgi:hypothetical protein
MASITVVLGFCSPFADNSLSGVVADAVDGFFLALADEGDHHG